MFSLDSQFYRLCLIIYRLIILNVLFIIGSIPIVTIGASFSALVAVIYQQGENILTAFNTSLQK